MIPDNSTTIIVAAIGAVVSICATVASVIVAVLTQRGRAETREGMVLNRETNRVGLAIVSAKADAVHEAVNGNTAALQQRLADANEKIADLNRQLPPKDGA